MELPNSQGVSRRSKTCAALVVQIPEANAHVQKENSERPAESGLDSCDLGGKLQGACALQEDDEEIEGGGFHGLAESN